jgi:hypothetical protein
MDHGINSLKGSEVNCAIGWIPGDFVWGYWLSSHKTLDSMALRFEVPN